MTKQFRITGPAREPLEVIRHLNHSNADELIVLDIMASRRNQALRIDLLSRICEECFLPLSYGGGVRTLEDVRDLFAAGVSKIIINTRAIIEPDLFRKASDVFGGRRVMAAIDVRPGKDGRYDVYANGGSRSTGISSVACARHMETAGASGIFLNSIDRDGTAQGYDLRLIRAVSSAVKLPVIACGGAGKPEHFTGAARCGASAAAVCGLFMPRTPLMAANSDPASRSGAARRPGFKYIFDNVININ